MSKCAMFGLFVLLVILSVCSKIEAQIPSFGSCPNVTAVANLNATRLVGVWYQAQRYFSVKNVGSSCNTCTFGVNVPALNGTSVIPSMYSQKQIGGLEMVVNGTNLVNSTGLITTKYNFNLGIPNDFIYIDIDYDNYGVAYHCHDILFGAFHSTSVWIYSRTRNITQVNLDKAYRAMTNQNISTTFLVTSNQIDCKPSATFC